MQVSVHFWRKSKNKQEAHAWSVVCAVNILSRYSASKSQLLVWTLLTSEDCTCSLTLMNKFPSTVVSDRCLSVIRGRGSRGTLRLRCLSGLCKAGGMADRRGATIYSSVQLRISAKVVGAASLLKHPSKYKICSPWSSPLIKMPIIRVFALAFDLCAL
jgi:hypothetical protein